MRTIIINGLRLTSLPFALFFCAAAGATEVHEYAARVAPGLDELRVRARFALRVRELRARSRSAARYLVEARDCDTGQSLAARGRGLAIPSGGVRCLDYVVDLERAAAAERRNAKLAGDNVVVPVSAWLWRPSESSGRVIVHFELAADMHVSAPWKPLDGHASSFEIMPSPRNAGAMTAFGRFILARPQLPGGELRIALMRPRSGLDPDEVLGWVHSAAGNVSLAYGRTPNSSPQVLVVPVGGRSRQGDSPVPWGHVLRDGGESVELFIDQHRPIAEFYDDWTATHEFSHLLLPYVRRGHRWISEGFAQYYQNVLLARAGQYDERRAWQKLYEGLERGRISRPELSPNEAAAAGVGAATMKIYWSGAALALVADVELRRRSDGRESLDAALDALQRCCLPSTRSWSGQELYQKMDSLVGEPVFMPLYRDHADTRGFPEFLSLLERLGVIVDEGVVHLSDDAELAEIRRAITTPP